MEECKMVETALSCGFSAAMVIDTKEFLFVPEYRKYCVENRCGNYDRNYGCPPYCGTTDEMEAKVRRFEKGLVLQSRSPIDNVFDGAVTKALKKEHTRKTRVLIRKLKEEGMKEEGMAIMAGPCNLCDACKMPEGLPCPHEKERFSCLSAYSIDAVSLANSCHMDIEWNGNIVSFFSIYVF